jgi:transcription elongation factor GreA
MSKVPLTVRGAERLREELKRLKSEDRPRVIAAIAEARAHGDLKENAEYAAAKEQQSFIEGRIKEIEGKLSNAEVIDVRQLGASGKAAGKVVFGATVVVEEVPDKRSKSKPAGETTWQIVGEDEADIRAGLISINSPIARALIGKHEGDEVVVQTPSGSRTYEVIEVRYE